VSRYVLGQDAAGDLDEIWEYIAADSIDAADRWLSKLLAEFDRLAKNPGIGHTRKDLTLFPLLFWPVGRYLVVYRAAKRPIEIVAVVHGARHIPAFLSSRVF